MKDKFIIIIIAVIIIGITSCSESFLDVYPDDQITAENFWISNSDADLALMGVYNSLLKYGTYYWQISFDAATPNVYQWQQAVNAMAHVGNGKVFAGTGGIVNQRWQHCYDGIHRANYFLESIDKLATLSQDEKKQMIGEVYFLRGVLYALLADTYGGVPIITKTITPAESQSLSRASLEDTWAQVHSDYDEAISRLSLTAPKKGRADLGAAYGMKMRAYLYQNNYLKVLEYVGKIEAIGKYSLFPSYKGLFMVENEGNSEVIFALQFLDGPIGQGSLFDRYMQPQNLKYGVNGASWLSPIQNLIDAYETIDGSPVEHSDDQYDLAQFNNRDPRLDFTVLRPGATWMGQLYPTEIRNHTGQRVGYGQRKYCDENNVWKDRESPQDFIILRYGDVLLAKAEALIETDDDISGAISIINRIRTERMDVKITSLPLGLSKEDARIALRKERRIEFAFEGTYWSDIKRWNIGPSLYPLEVRGSEGELIETKFPQGYDLKFNLLPIPQSEIGMNNNLVQNPGY